MAGSPENVSYRFYQFWLNASDEDVKKYVRIFTLMTKEEIETMEKEHASAPHLRLMQKALAKDITTRVHSVSDYDAAVEASEILFGKGTAEALNNLSEEDLLNVFEGVPQVGVERVKLDAGINMVEFLSDTTKIFASRGEAKKMMQGGGVALNKIKVEDTGRSVTTADLLKGKYVLVQKGKKNYYLIFST
jgi:tyrosyl-tRNA synthetase